MNTWRVTPLLAVLLGVVVHGSREPIDVQHAGPCASLGVDGIGDPALECRV